MRPLTVEESHLLRDSLATVPTSEVAHRIFDNVLECVSRCHASDNPRERFAAQQGLYHLVSFAEAADEHELPLHQVKFIASNESEHLIRSAAVMVLEKFGLHEVLQSEVDLRRYPAARGADDARVPYWMSYAGDQDFGYPSIDLGHEPLRAVERQVEDGLRGSLQGHGLLHLHELNATLDKRPDFLVRFPEMQPKIEGIALVERDDPLWRHEVARLMKRLTQAKSVG